MFKEIILKYGSIYIFIHDCGKYNHNVYVLHLWVQQVKNKTNGL